MRVAYLIAGAGGMYCGSCLRDNRVAATLLARGCDLVVIPLYTPIRTDETDVSTKRVYYGGLNVYLQQKAPPLRLLPHWLLRVLDSPALLRQAARFSDRTRPQDLGALTVSVLRGEEGRQRTELDKLVDGLKAVRPDLVSLPNLMFTGAVRRLKSVLGVPVVCTLSGEDVFLDPLPEPHRTQSYELIRDRAGLIDGFLAVSKYYAGFAAERFHLPPERIHVAPMGIDVNRFPESVRPGGNPLTIGYFARICPEKGLLRLAEAFVRLRRAGQPCRLRAAGYVQDRAYLSRVQSYLAAEGLADDFDFFGEVDRNGKIAFLSSLDVFSVPTVYAEPKGLYVLEALACGVPVVLPRHGSFPELLDATGGGILYDDGATTSLEDALARLINDAALRKQLSVQGRTAVRTLFTDDIMADRTWEIFTRYAHAAGSSAQSGGRTVRRSGSWGLSIVPHQSL